MPDPSRAEAQRSSSFRLRPSELLRTYASDPKAPRPDELQRLVSELDIRQSELEVQNQKLQAAQRQLEAYRDRYIDLYDFAPLGYVTLDEDGYIQEINLAGARLLGCERAELVGYPFTDCVGMADRAAFLEHIGKCCGQRQETTSELGLIAKDGRSVAVQLHSVPITAIEHEAPFCKTAVTDITERKRAAEAVQAERNLLRTLIDNLPDAVYIKDTQSRFLVANLAGARIAGATTPDDLLGKRDHDFYPQEAAAEYYSDEQALMRTGEPLVNKDEPHLDSEGNLRTVLTTKVPLKDSRGTIVGLVGISRDITEAKQIEEALRKSEQQLSENEARLRLAQQAARAGTWDLDLLTGQVIVSEETWALWGVTPRAPESFDWLATVYPEDRPLAESRLRQAMQQPGDARCEYRIAWPDGQVRWHYARGRTLADADGRPLRLVGITTDITERKRAEEALRESQQRLRLALESAELGWWSWDFAAGLIEGDDKTKSLLGSAAATVPFEAILQNTHPDDRAWLQERTVELHSRAGNYEVEFRVVRPDGSIRWAAARGRSFADADGKPVRAVGIAMDITDRKRAEEELAAAKAAAEQANRAKDHFLAVLSHELRTPLTPVVMGVSMLQNRPDLDPVMRETLEMVRRNTEMEARLIDDLLDVTRIARGKIELVRSPVELCTVIQRAVEVCRPDIDARGLDFAVDWGPSAPYWINADEPRLQQVFWNLLSNAIKFTPQGGCVGIRCRRDGAYMVIEVSDSGMGIEAEALPRVFKAFEQVEQSITRQFGGLGLGLAICKTLVELHGGTISAQSEGKGQGATFSIRLPLTRPVSRSAALPPPASPRPAVRPLRILLVEDHRVTAIIIRMILTTEGHSVETAGDVATALELAGREAFDLLVSDLGLPDATGHDLMRQLRSRGHKLPGIALSGYGQEEDVRRSYEAGFASHLTKPASREAVVEAVAAVTAGEMPAAAVEPATSR